MTTGTKNTLINTVTKQAASAVKAGYFVKDGADGVSHSDLAATDVIFGFVQHGGEEGKDVLVNPKGSPGVFEAVANGAIAVGDLIKVVKAGNDEDVRGRVVEADTSGDEVVGQAEESTTAAGQLITFTMREGVVA